MREQGNGTLFSPERKRVSVKVNGKDEGTAGRRRLSGGGYGVSNGGGKPSIANNHVTRTPLTGARLKGGSTTQSRQPNSLSDNSFVTEVAVADGEHINKKRASEEGVLPQWGHGKRSRCSRLEPLKHTSPVNELASKSDPRSEKATAPLPRGPSKLTSHKSISNGFLLRNGLINRAANGFVDTSISIPSLSVRQNGGEAKEGPLQKERASSTQQKNASTDNGICRQRNDGSSELATTPGHVHGNGHTNKIMNSTNNGTSNGHVNKISNNKIATCVVPSEPNTAACSFKMQVDLQTIEWPRIVIPLTRKEKEDDFLVFKGSKLPQRPKKRPKVVEKALHYCTPGNWLSDLSRGRYDVREKKSMKKRPRGLKAMESLESDSE